MGCVGRLGLGLVHRNLPWWAMEDFMLGIVSVEGAVVEVGRMVLY